MDISDGASLELADKFYYPVNTLSIDTDSGAAVEARVRRDRKNLGS